MAVTKEKPFPQALAEIAAGFQNAEPTVRTHVPASRFGHQE
jgi:hypothetical protein